MTTTNITDPVIIDCPDCTDGGMITKADCATCGSCRWIEQPAAAKPETVHLIGLGRYKALPAAQIEPGMTLVYNYGETARVLDVSQLSAKTVEITVETKRGPYTRRYRASTLIATAPSRAPRTPRTDCGCVLGRRGPERLCRYHQAEDDAIYAANERRRSGYDLLPPVDTE